MKLTVKQYRIINIVIAFAIMSIGSLHGLTGVVPAHPMAVIIGLSGIALCVLEVAQKQAQAGGTWDAMRLLNVIVSAATSIGAALSGLGSFLSPEQVGTITTVYGFIIMNMEFLQAAIEGTAQPPLTISGDGTISSSG